MTGEASILFRCDGNSQVGLGHVYRCIALADELLENHKCKIAFAMLSGEAGFEIVENANYQIYHNIDGASEENWLNDLINKVKPNSLVLDVRTGLQRSSLVQWRENGVIIATIDDPEDKRLAADLVFCPPVPGVHIRDWSELSGELFVGWEWVPLRRMFAKKHHIIPSDRLRILVTMGGSDEAGFTLKAIEALNELDGDFDTTVILGGAYAHPKQLQEALLQSDHNYKVLEKVSNMAEIIANTDLAIASFGVTAYELAAMSVPAIFLCLKNDHVLSASAFVDAGFAISLGIGSDISVSYFSNRIGKLLKNKIDRNKMSDLSSRLMDGKGAKRIALKIVSKLQQNKI